MLTVIVHFHRRFFHGLREDGSVDWPPSPARLAGALMAGAHALKDPAVQEAALGAIRAITCADPPAISAPQHVALGIPDTFTEQSWLPDRATAKTLKSYVDLGLLAMASTSRTKKPQDGVALADDWLGFEIDASLSDNEALALSQAAAQIGYFGRSSDPAEILVHRGKLDDAVSAGIIHSGSIEADLRRQWWPRPSARGLTRGWQPNTVDWYEANFARTFGTDVKTSSLSPLPALGYVRPLHYSTVLPQDENCTVVPLERSIPQHSAPTILSALNTELPAGWLAFPAVFTTSRWADGRCVGIGLMRQVAQRANQGPSSVASSSTDTSVVVETGPSNASTDLVHVEMLVEQWLASRSDLPGGQRVISADALDASHWSSTSRHWRSVTPLRAFPDLRVLQHQLSIEADRRFGSGITVVEASVEPVPRFAERWSNARFTDGYGQWWLEIEFDDEITGPVLLGASTDHGHGLFRPLKEAS